MQAESPAAGSVSTATVEASSTLVLGMTGTVKGEKLVMMDSPGAGGAELSSLSQDEPFEVVEKRGTWYKIRDGDGHLGWIVPDPQIVTIESK
jgi:SH3-like domain-containing protein